MWFDRLNVANNLCDKTLEIIQTEMQIKREKKHKTKKKNRQ